MALSGLDLDFLGVTKGLTPGSGSFEPEASGDHCLCFPLFFTGENGLVVNCGASDLTARDLVRTEDEAGSRRAFGGVDGGTEETVSFRFEELEACFDNFL